MHNPESDYSECRRGRDAAQTADVAALEQNRSARVRNSFSADTQAPQAFLELAMSRCTLDRLLPDVTALAKGD